MRRKAILFVAVMVSMLAQADNINPALQVKEFKLSGSSEPSPRFFECKVTKNHQKCIIFSIIIWRFVIFM